MLANPPSPVLNRPDRVIGIESDAELEDTLQNHKSVRYDNAKACGCPRLIPTSGKTSRNISVSLEEVNPVIESTRIQYEKTNLVKVDNIGVQAAANYISRKLREETYTPTTWRTHPLHVLPPSPFDPHDPQTRATLDWIFLISSLNFSFWSDKEGLCPGDAKEGRYAVEWWKSWEEAKGERKERKLWTGYWSLVAAINRALEDDIPITDPSFYSCPERCPDSAIESVFTPAPHCTEHVPIIKERIRVLREVGSILCENFGGSFQGFLTEFHKRHRTSPGGGSALQLVKMVTDTFPSFRDETVYEDQIVYFWKRAQILVAETWAAFYPLSSCPSSTPCNATHEQHPFLPNGVSDLTMFADYRVPQILHHLGILSYPPSLVDTLRDGTYLKPGCREEISIRAASILGVEAVKDVILRESSHDETECDSVSSVLIDFYLWDLAKKIERGEEVVTGISTREILPAHRTRSIWY